MEQGKVVVARKRSNPLALAVLATLLEHPMHPYELATTLRSRRKEDSIRLNYGSLYSVVQSMERAGLIEAQETTRAGRRPERTVYAITDAGRLEVVDWLSMLLSTPTKEYTNFEAGLSLMPVMSPDDAAALLEERVVRLTELLRTLDTFEEMAAGRIGRIHMIEAEYKAVLYRAERDWLTTLIAEIRKGTLDGLSDWRGYHTDLSEDPAPGS
ncbi:PadR family transcriptional regulator [Spongiactinospora rosea]|uniref:PadR family transcriptional regulator n=1 Tax=Spongiactinospora rosea TaxID=2248750 RepID=UPI0018F4B429|nr:helix-turn-helix transcriptional regulator [Spongiactinospora rosea]